MKKYKRNGYKNINFDSLHNEDLYLNKNIHEYINDFTFYKFIKYLSLLITFNYFSYITIKELFFNLKTKNVFEEISTFENQNVEPTESDILRFYEFNSKNILLKSDRYNNNLFNPDVSVILLMYNQEKIIHTALRSIQNQSLKNIEIIIIDDCSFDQSTIRINPPI